MLLVRWVGHSSVPPITLSGMKWGVGFTDQKLIYHLQDFRKNTVLRYYISVTVSFLGPICISKKMKRKRSSDHTNRSPNHPHEDKLIQFVSQEKCLSRFISSITLKPWFVIHLNGAVTEVLWTNTRTLHPGALLKRQQGHLDTSFRGIELVWITSIACIPSLSSCGDERKKEGAGGGLHMGCAPLRAEPQPAATLRLP